MPIAVARNGNVSPGTEFNRRALRMISTFAIKVTSIGSNNVPITTAKISFLSGNSRKANA